MLDMIPNEEKMTDLVGKSLRYMELVMCCY